MDSVTHNGFLYLWAHHQAAEHINIKVFTLKSKQIKSFLSPECFPENFHRQEFVRLHLFHQPFVFKEGIKQRKSWFKGQTSSYYYYVLMQA